MNLNNCNHSRKRKSGKANRSRMKFATNGHLLILNFILCFIATATRNALAQSQYLQHNNILHFFVPENQPNNTYIGNIRSSDGQLPYLILPAPQTPESERLSALQINFDNGDLTTNSVLDREHREQYHFVAIVKEPFAEIKCTVTVKDVNDNAPMFIQPSTTGTAGGGSTNSTEASIRIEMPENRSGIRVTLPLALDLDTPDIFGIKEFRIVSGNTPPGIFRLVDQGAQSAPPANLPATEDSSSNMPIDNPQLQEQFARQQTVLIPSQPHMQSSSSSSSSFPSSSPSAAMGSSVSLQASPNSAVSSSPQSKYLIYLENTQPLDREMQSNYTLVVEALDGGQPPLLGRLMVTVIVLDANDNKPVFNRDVYECQLKEDTAKGTVITRVQAHDIDSDSNGQISYFIKRAPVQMFEIDPIKGEIILTSQLDYEKDKVHELLIEGRDHGKPSKNAFTTVKVFVIDVDDDPPPQSSSTFNRTLDDKKQLTQVPSSEASRSEIGGASELIEAPRNYFQNFHILNWFTQINSSLLFVIVLVALIAVASSVCLLKIKSRSEYNDKTLTSNNIQTKQSPIHTHSTSNDHSNGSNDYSNGSNDNHHRHHDHQRLPLPMPPHQTGSSATLQQPLLPPTPCNAQRVFTWPQGPCSTMGCFPSPAGPLYAQGSTIDCTPASQPLDRWFDLGVSSQLVHSHDWYGSYNWDYLKDWAPEYQTVMQLLQADARGY